MNADEFLAQADDVLTEWDEYCSPDAARWRGGPAVDNGEPLPDLGSTTDVPPAMRRIGGMRLLPPTWDRYRPSASPAAREALERHAAQRYALERYGGWTVFHSFRYANPSWWVREGD